jgi:type VI secretion system secreted protein Hcp
VGPVAIADMFLKLAGVTGEARDDQHKGEIEVVSWSWGMAAPTAAVSGQAAGKAAMSEVTVVKRVDQATPTLMQYLRHHKPIATARLTVRKAGAEPLEYFRLELEQVRITGLTTDSQESELIEQLKLGFQKVTVTYIPQQGGTGAKGGGDVIFTADAQKGN